MRGVQLPLRFVFIEMMVNLLDSDLDAGLLRELVTAAVHMAIASWKAGAALGDGAARLAGGDTLGAFTGLVFVRGVVRAEGAVAADGTGVGLTVPRHHAAEATRAAGEAAGHASAKVHAAETVDQEAFVAAGANGQ